jgi:hypothetical protein
MDSTYRIAKTLFSTVMVCFRNISVNTLHGGGGGGDDYDYDDDSSDTLLRGMQYKLLMGAQFLQRSKFSG